MMNCGIYWLKFPNGQFYVGSSCVLKRRIRCHVWHLEHRRHPNDRLQKTYDKYRWVESGVLLICARTQLKFYEQIIIDGLLPVLNLSKIADRPEMTPEVCAKISLAATGRVCSDETRRRMSVSRMGRKHSPEAKALMSVLAKGRRNSEEAKAKMAKAKRGGKHTSEHKAKVVAALNRRWAGKTPEQRRANTANAICARLAKRGTERNAATTD